MGAISKSIPEYLKNEKHFRLKIPQRSKWDNYTIIFQQDDTVIYTDGSKAYSRILEIYSSNHPLDETLSLWICALISLRFSFSKNVSFQFLKISIIFLMKIIGKNYEFVAFTVETMGTC